MVHFLHLGGFKFSKFVGNVPNVIVPFDGSTQSTKPKVIASSEEEFSHALALIWITTKTLKLLVGVSNSRSLSH